ncbi:MAG: type I methionyl aminopeptidase [Pseudomonadota bacterium]
MLNKKIKIYGPEAFEGMKKAGQLAAQALDLMVEHVAPGVTTEHLDDIAFEFAMDHNATPAPLYYRGFPKSICTSPNHVICHGIPGPKALKEGDILNVDITLILDGWHGDSSRMYNVGQIKRKPERLVKVTYDCLMRGISIVKAGTTLGDIGHTIQTYAESEGFSVVRDFCGHGIGDVFHQQPNVLHYGSPGTGLQLEEGMMFTIEPMINTGRPEMKTLNDGWTAVTRDRSLSAQFEHTIGVTREGCEIFTTSPRGLDCPPYH